MKQVLETSGSHRAQLEAVIRHFSASDNPEKLKAAYFLIGNMEEKHWLAGEEKDHYHQLYDFTDSLWKTGMKVNADGKELLQTYWDSLTTVYGFPNKQAVTVFLDKEHLDSAYLIQHIEQAFKARETLPWCKDLAFDDFCEYVLPYRMATEEPEDWSSRMWEKWQTARDTIKTPDRMTMAKIINDYHAIDMRHIELFRAYPFDVTVTDFEKAKLGSCEHSVYYTAMVMRANGLPVGVDYVQFWGGASGGHEWNVLLKEDGHFYPFDAILKGFGMDYSWRRIAKVFRETYTRQELAPDTAFSDEVPESLQNAYRKDVTDQYVKTFDISIPLFPYDRKMKYAVISTFNNQSWVPQYWGTVKGDEGLFKNMGANIAYTAYYYDERSYTRASEPFVLDTLGNVRSLKASEDKVQDMRLTRKYPFTAHTAELMSFVIGNRIQGASKQDFSDSVTLFTVDRMPEKIETAQVNDERSYRYARVWIPPGKRGDMAELEVYGLAPNGKDTVKLKGKVIGSLLEDITDPIEQGRYDRLYDAPFDGDLLTYFILQRKMEPWVGLDFGSPQRIVKVRYCPRSDVNFIEQGDRYELFYWDEGMWISLGKKTAEDQTLHYTGVPADGLYILRDLTKGKEERIFTYEDNKQVWW